jgi:cobaltochelatase CobS
MYKKFAVTKTFDIEGNDGFEVMGFEDASHPKIPVAKPDYLFRKEHLMFVLLFLTRPAGDGLYVFGPHGAGKTSLVTQAAAKLNWPVHEVTCTGRLELNDLVGRFDLAGGSMRFVHGSLSQAVRDGHILMLNETDLMDPSELSGLNDILEGAPLVIPQNGGEVIKPHPMFRVAVTANSNGFGDDTGMYSGAKMMNQAFMDRFRLLKVDYLSAEEETGLLAHRLAAMGVPNVANLGPLLGNMVAVANEVRRLFSGGEEGSGEIRATMSHRVLFRWVNMFLSFRRMPNGLAYTLDGALTQRVDPSEREAIHRIAQNIFGDAWVGV